MKREYPEHPIVGVGAAIFEQETILLVRRNQEPARGQWSLPGGMVELGESLLVALRRELWEETSVKVEVGGLLGAFDKIFHDLENRVQYHYVVIDYWGRIASGQPRPGSDISEVQLVPIKGLDAFEIDRDLRSTIMKAVDLRKQSPIS